MNESERYTPGTWSAKETQQHNLYMRKLHASTKGRITGMELFPTGETLGHVCLSRILNQPDRIVCRKRKHMPLLLMKMLVEHPKHPQLYRIHIPSSLLSDNKASSCTTFASRPDLPQEQAQQHAAAREDRSGNVLFSATRREKIVVSKVVAEIKRPLLEMDPKDYHQTSCMQGLSVNQTKSVLYILRKGKGYTLSSTLPSDLTNTDDMTIAQFATMYVLEDHLRRHDRIANPPQAKRRRLAATN